MMLEYAWKMSAMNKNEIILVSKQIWRDWEPKKEGWPPWTKIFICHCGFPFTSKADSDTVCMNAQFPFNL